jgi:hypothetical protein
MRLAWAIAGVLCALAIPRAAHAADDESATETEGDGEPQVEGPANTGFCLKTTCQTDTCKENERIGECVREGARIRWPSTTVRWRFQKAPTRDDEQARKAVRSAFDRWSWKKVDCEDGRPTSLHFVEDKPSGAADAPFTVFFRDDEWPHDGADETLALTTHAFKSNERSKKVGNIENVKLEINTASQQFAFGDLEQGVDLEAVVTHEVGHYIGIAHTKTPDSIMVPSYCASQSRCSQGPAEARRLSAVDIEAVCTLFPPDGLGGYDDDTPPPTSCSAAPSSPFATGITATSLLFAGVLIVLRRRAKRARGE